MNGRIVRLAAACLILAAAFLLFQHTRENERIAELIEGCRNAPTAPERSIRDCNGLLELGDQSPAWVASIHRLRGRAYIGLEEWQRAMADVNKAKALNPDDYYVWQYTSFIQRKRGDSEAAYDAMETAYRLAPFHENTVKLRFWVLQDLAQYDEADAYFSELMTTHPVTEYEHLLWIPRMLGKMRFKLEQYGPAAEAYKEALRVDLKHDETRQKFLEACRFAGPECPPLFLERRASYSVLTCEEAIQRWEELHPKFVEHYVSDAGFETLEEFIAQDELRAKIILQALYLGPAAAVEEDFPSSDAARFLVENRVFDCVNGGVFVELDRHSQDVDLKFTNEHLYSPQLRNNLVELAHAALKTPPQQ